MATKEQILEVIRAFRQRVRQTETPETDDTPHCVECGEISPCEFERSRE